MNRKKSSYFSFGYTLIELMVVITISLIIMAMGIASFSQFNKRQKVKVAADDIVSRLRLAQKLATAGSYSGCAGVFDGTQFSVTSGNSYKIEIICGGTEFDYADEDYLLVEDVVFVYPPDPPGGDPTAISVRFTPLAIATESLSDFCVKHEREDLYIKISISQAGVIDSYEIEETCP